jgi:hypothetical protein
MKAMPFRQHEQLWPFPSLPEAVKARYAVSDLALRPFGLDESDLNVDFARTPRPILVTRLLECCTQDAQKEKVEQSLFWHLPVGKRIECLLTLLLSGAGSEIPVAFRCPNTTCEERSEIEISIEEVAALQEEAYATDRVEVALENEILALRRPTGSDQLVWLKGNFTDRGAALRAMVRTLLLSRAEDVDVRGGTLRDEWLASIEQAMEEHDPLVNFKLRVKCPSCESDHLVTIDLEELSLRGLRQAQLRLLASVHRLAAHYHWSEQQIFAVPYWRRAHYLSLIENEKNQ